jgi:hypothetical protein
VLSGFQIALDNCFNKIRRTILHPVSSLSLYVN